MVEVGYVQDDRIIIPDDIKKMSKEQLEEEIAKLENEIKERKHKEQLAAETAQFMFVCLFESSVNLYDSKMKQLLYEATF